MNRFWESSFKSNEDNHTNEEIDLHLEQRWHPKKPSEQQPGNQPDDAMTGVLRQKMYKYNTSTVIIFQEVDSFEHEINTSKALE